MKHYYKYPSCSAVGLAKLFVDAENWLIPTFAIVFRNILCKIFPSYFDSTTLLPETQCKRWSNGGFHLKTYFFIDKILHRPNFVNDPIFDRLLTDALTPRTFHEKIIFLILCLLEKLFYSSLLTGFFIFFIFFVYGFVFYFPLRQINFYFFTKFLMP